MHSKNMFFNDNVIFKLLFNVYMYIYLHVSA